MRRFLTISFFACCLLSPISAIGQHAHSDLEFEYDSLGTPTKFVIESDEFTSDGFLFFEGEFADGDPAPGNQLEADDPGFATHGLRVNPGDQIWLNFLNASDHSGFGRGYVTYFDPMTSALSAAGRIGVIDNAGSTLDLLMNGGFLEAGSGPTRQFLQTANSFGGIHSHVTFDLLDDDAAPIGAYGVMFEMQSLFNGNTSGLADLTSEPIWFIFNHGMSDDDFDSIALPAFGVSAIPEPGSAGVLLLTGMATLLRRRKR